MKKKILSGIFALALLITAGYGVNKSVNDNADLNDLALSNVEALAQSEDGDGYGCSVSITCLDEATISCHGSTYCTYGRDTMGSIGYVCCDGNYTYCQGYFRFLINK